MRHHFLDYPAWKEQMEIIVAIKIVGEVTSNMKEVIQLW